MLVYSFRIKLFGFNACYSPEFIGVNSIEIAKENTKNIITIEGDIVSSALFYSDYTYKIENGVLRVGVSYNLFNLLSTGSSKFLIKIESKEKINVVYLSNNETEKMIYPSKK